ncbi:hypothetical protein XENTR_v10003467 [Xenopus tropicalis]|uniref:Chloride channel CLIC-like protein 1 n=1 Tax=Xenopus tropicalis TaxID=8364 RepID=A0A8J1IZW5_XENTR|nr:chloride channel CLIC-like protein 1 [Xenopus tropicalis]XP_031750295.1 chloride channel CLIC-like protein 1 [Xenopus tropicalis]XP_031750296.1 chloride channel CLIC-like protein 1 [Xenopus tropicalis]KAE8574514.1 hypothetical protein XENTR_v10003467 [Xenopus tropicalis]
MMGTISLWISNQITFIRYVIVGFPEAEDEFPPPWSLQSPFPTWNIYSKAFLVTSLMCYLVAFSMRFCRGAKTSARGVSAPVLNAPAEWHRPLLASWIQMFALFLVLCLFLSVPWEWVRLYQMEVAKKTSVLSEGNRRQCDRQDLSLWETIKVLLSWNFSWASNSCEDYYKAIIVDPFWEVTPLMAIGSAVTRTIVHPMELLSHVLGRSLRNVMKEVPSQWQLPVFLLLPLALVTVLLTVYLGRNRSIQVTCQPPTVKPKSKSIKAS